ncbi:tRNA (adenosine(37)-N6)-threonylcarbamoyltransferase complex dimerization subunit type 1 TsaB [Novisyntrophococcus fermenticellae]|uniref:tRNA (adenosine(37)-N6)-threonylcarbamoyltransferase complex dimerization subunit type 1 TsaB n=1 Tax=Novisyntrophococcus fermenticellae TaxID=2068655 RepID=UPI001E5C0254|nr:tRNA (adenosine(37)-N6)-threonylcarbamoyltransferase complex dimerization subunit type 1 TsaB [Novisyntrophococcus fermenticellae]
MKLLALDSSGLVASVAILEDENLLAEYTVNYKKTHSQTLLPMLDTIAQMIELDLNTIDAIAIASGPGSFTGLRIGSATAKGLGLALGKPLIEVPTVEALAYNIYDSDKIICPIMDARRSQVYTGIYDYEDHVLRILEDQMAIGVTDLAEKLNLLGREVIFLGDGAPVYRDLLESSLIIPYSYAPAHVNKQRAAAVGALGEIYYARGIVVSAEAHRPEYLRKPQAEREREEAVKSAEKTEGEHL